MVNTKAAHDASGTGLILMEKNSSYHITLPKCSQDFTINNQKLIIALGHVRTIGTEADNGHTRIQ